MVKGSFKGSVEGSFKVSMDLQFLWTATFWCGGDRGGV